MRTQLLKSTLRRTTATANRSFVTESRPERKVAILDAAGGIGQPLALLMKLNPLVSKLALYDIVATPGVAADVGHINTRAEVTGYVGEEQLGQGLEWSDVVIIPAGVPRKPGMTRDDLFNINAGIVKSLSAAIAKYCPHALVNMISNPVNSTVPIAAEVFKKADTYDEKKLFGVTGLDVARAKTFYAGKAKVPIEEVNVPVIGGHAGITILPLFSQATSKANLAEEDIKPLTKRTEDGGTEVVEAKAGKGSATLSMAVDAISSTAADEHKAFDTMPPGMDCVSMTALLSGYTRKGLFLDALVVFRKMHQSGIKANEYTYVSTLVSCTKLKCLGSGKQVQACLQKDGFIGNLFVHGALVVLHSKCGNIEDASYIFETTSFRDLISWNGMIGGYGVNGFTNESFRSFQAMLREGISPDHFTLGSLLGSCNHSLHLSKICQLHALILQLGFESHVRLGAQLVDAYSKCGSIESGSHVFRNMQEKDLLSCTAMINGYGRGIGHARDAVNLFLTMYQSGMILDDVLLCSMLNICANTVSLSLGRQIHSIVVKFHVGCDIATSNALIDMYAKCGELDEASNVFDGLEGKNLISWSSLICGYAQHGCGLMAMATFNAMEDEGFVPNQITFLSLLFACSQNGLVTDGLEYLNSMISKYGITPGEKHYSCMLDLLGRSGHIEEAIQLINKMNISPSPSMWKAILGACSVHKNVSIGKAAANQLFQLDPQNCSYYLVLSGLYADAGLWDSAWITCGLMKERNLKKFPGCSKSLVTRYKLGWLQG